MPPTTGNHESLKPETESPMHDGVSRSPAEECCDTTKKATCCEPKAKPACCGTTGDGNKGCC
jgi:hypothetical protein